MKKQKEILVALIIILAGLIVYATLAPSEQFKWWWNCNFSQKDSCETIKNLPRNVLPYKQN